MRRTLLFLAIVAVASSAFGGFKAKIVKPKKAEQFQARVEVSGVTLAADLLIDEKEQKEFFYKELTPSNVIAVRLAVFNSGAGDVVLPLEGIRLLGPDGNEIPQVGPAEVANAILQGQVVSAKSRERKPGGVQPSVGQVDPRTDRGNPRYDPRTDPTSPSYDPNDPRNQGYDPNDPRNRGGYPNDPRARSTNPNDPRYDPTYGGGGTRNTSVMRPNIGGILNPGSRGGGGDLTPIERELAEKDFSDKSHDAGPIPRSFSRDKFLYFSTPARPMSVKGFVLQLPSCKGIGQEVILKF